MGLEKRGGILGQAEGNGLWNVVECGGPVCPFLLYLQVESHGENTVV